MIAALILFAAVLLAIVVGALCLIATWGDAAGARRILRLRAATRWRPPANARRRDFDEWGRPW